MTPPTVSEPEAFDLDYRVDEDMPPGPYPPDSEFVFARAPQLITDKATQGAGGRVLDVGCGFGGQMALLRERGWETWGLDASMALTRYCRHRLASDHRAALVCAVAEALPFRSQSLDRVVCQGSLDHFVRPQTFFEEVARVLRPDGLAVIAIANYDSLSCRLGRGLFRLKERFGVPVYRGRLYWEKPANHTFRGTHRVLRELGEPYLELVECRGVSLLWLFHRWTWLMRKLPRGLAWWALTALDRIAYRTPAMADLLVSVWRPRKRADAGS